MKQAFQIRFVSKEGKRKTATFRTIEAATYFFNEVSKKEDQWKAVRLIEQMEVNNG